MRTLSHYIIYFKMQVTVRDLWFDVTLQSDARKVPVETSVSAQLYVMTTDSLCGTWKKLKTLKST